MFELPQAKRVRREDLHDSRSPSAESSDSEDAFKKQRFEYEIKEQVIPGAQKDEASDEDGLAFNLFASTTGNDTAPTVIRIRSPSLASGDQDFNAVSRPDHYYFTGTPSNSLFSQYRASAASGEDVKLWSQRHCPGSVYAWKLRSLPAAQHKVADAIAVGIEADDSRRKRLGKKGRIKKRKRLAEQAARGEKVAMSKEGLERAEREKRAKRNREKKLKKRARDKVKKQSTAAGAESDDTAND